MNLVFANAPKENNLSLSFLLVLLRVQGGGGSGNICKGSGQTWAARRGRPTPPDRSWPGRWAMAPGWGQKPQLSSASDKRGVFCKGEVAKTITRGWEENQGVARAPRRLGGSPVGGASMLPPAEPLPGESRSWEGGSRQPEAGQRAGWAAGTLSVFEGTWFFRVERHRGSLLRSLNKGGNAPSPELNRNQNRSPPSPIFQARPLPLPDLSQGSRQMF